MSVLNLTFPAQQQGQHLLVETQFEPLKLWVDEIPYGRMLVALDSVLDKVAKLNRTVLSTKERYQLMSLFHTPYRVIHDYYYDSNFFKERTDPSKNNRAPKALRALTKEFSYSFKLIASEMANKRSFLSKNKNLAIAFNWALQYLELNLLDHYIGYEHAPNYLWREIHQLYAYAEEKNFHQLSLPVDKEDFCLATISDTYKRILLVSECSPYHLERGQLWDIFSYLKHWSILAEINPDTSACQQEQCFMIYLDSDHKPLYAADEVLAPESQQIRLMHTKALVQKLALQIESIDKHRQAPQPGFHESINIGVARKLLEEMKNRWDKKYERKGERAPEQIQMDFVWGLNSIRQVLAEKDTLTRTAELPAINQAQEPEPFLALQAINCRWQTINASKNGLRIHNNQKELPNLEVGQLAIFRRYIEGKPSKRWDLGVIRWLEESSNDGTDIGMELINGHPQPVILKTNVGHGKAASMQSALLVSGDEIHGMYTPTIIAPPKVFYEGRDMHMVIGDETLVIKAQLKATETGHFTRFFYQSLEPESAQLAQEQEQEQEQAASNDNEDENEIILDDTFRLDDFEG